MAQAEVDALRLIYHCETKDCECICGQILGKFHHECQSSIKDKTKLEISPCDPCNCERCLKHKQEERNTELYYAQWNEYGNPRDGGEAYCSVCYDRVVECTLPKQCLCEWYIDEEGKCRCKKCHSDKYRTEDDFCEKCECCWFYNDDDDDNQKICTACDKRIKRIVDGCECEHWYIDDDDDDDYILCRKCNTRNYNDNPCNKCGNDSTLPPIDYFDWITRENNNKEL